MASMSKDPHASYYDVGGIEVIEILRAKLSPEEYRGFLKGNVLKYLLRHGHKHVDDGSDARDLRKALVYLRWLTDEQPGGGE